MNSETTSITAIDLDRFKSHSIALERELSWVDPGAAVRVCEAGATSDLWNAINKATGGLLLTFAAGLDGTIALFFLGAGLATRALALPGR